jgi:hypothetical protein
MGLIDRLTGTASVCRIAIVQPVLPADLAARALRFFDSVLWVFQGTARAQWVMGSPGDAAVVVAHHQTDPDQLQQWRAAGKHVVVISTDPTYRDPAVEANGLLLSFPFKTAEAISLLSRIDSEVIAGRRPVVAVATVAVNSVDAVETLRLLRSAEVANRWLVGKINGRIIWVMGNGRQYRCAPQTIQDIRAGAGCSNLQVASQSVPPPGLVTRPGSELMWFLAYHASSELMFDLSSSTTVRLQTWPDLGLLRTADAAANAAQLRIIAALDVMPATLPELSYRAAATSPDVVRMINALHACDCTTTLYAQERRLPPPKIAAPASIAGGVRGFLRNIRKHLGLHAAA